MTQHQPIKQHLIDPEICIRCHTCEEACSIGAITHNEDNVVVDASICNFCMDCIAPCPTGSIDNWRIVTEAYSVDEQLEWMELPEQGEVDAGDGDEDDVVARLLEEAHAGAGGAAFAPASAATPAVNLFTKDAPATAKVQGTSFWILARTPSQFWRGKPLALFHREQTTRAKLTRFGFIQFPRPVTGSGKQPTTSR